MSNLKRKPGRPPIAGEAMEQISIRLTPDEIAEVNAYAVEIGASRNEAVRELLNCGLNAVACDRKSR